MKVFSLLLTLHAFLGKFWAKMKFVAGTLTTYRVDRLATVYERTYVCHRIFR
jgi:hypothetical protein